MNIQIHHLVEPGVKYYVNESLKKCRTFKDEYYNSLFNVGLFISLIVGLSIIMIYKYKGKLTPVELAAREEEKKAYIMSKIRNFQEARKRKSQTLITGLPEF